MYLVFRIELNIKAAVRVIIRTTVLLLEMSKQQIEYYHHNNKHVGILLKTIIMYFINFATMIPTNKLINLLTDDKTY